MKYNVNYSSVPTVSVCCWLLVNMVVFLLAYNSRRDYEMCKEVKKAMGIPLSFLLDSDHILFLVHLDVFGPCCIHISVELHQSLFGSGHIPPEKGVQQGSDASIHT